MPARTYYAFGRFRLAADGSMLLRDDAAVALAPKSLRTLVTLVEHAGEVVTKIHLLETVWPDSFVEDTGLTRNISVIRRALGEDERFIATVARVGYRFIEPVTVLESVHESRVTPTAIVGRGDRQLPLVGRADEFAALRRAFDEAVRGPGRMIAVTGEAGIGKTTLVDTFLQEIKGAARIGRGRCSERLAGAEPHLPVLEALDEWTGGDSGMLQALGRTAPTWLRHISPKSSSRAAAIPETADQASARTSERLMRELTMFLEEASRERPLILIVEDLHWTDVSSVDVLVHLATRLSRLRLLIVITYRHYELALRDHPFVRVREDLIARGQMEELAISLLTPDEVQEYVLAAFDVATMPSDLPAFIFRKTEGNPLFMADLVRYLQKRGVLTAEPATVLDVPDSLRALIERTLRGLQPAARQLMSVAAVQGCEFDSTTLARVSSLAAADVEELLERLARVHALIAPERETTQPDGTLTVVYRFVHVLYQDALVESVPPSKRSEWAKRIAETLMLTHGTRLEHIAAQLATLFETGRDFWRASQHFLTASRSATGRFAFREAVDLAVRGLACLAKANGIDQTHVEQRELDLTFAQLIPLASLEGYASAEAERLSARLVALGELLNDAPATAAALSATWMIRIVRGQCAAAKDAALRFVALAQAAGDKVLLMNSHMHAQIALHHLGEFEVAAAHSAAVIAGAGGASIHERRTTIFDPVVASLAESSRNSLITGRLRQAEHDVSAALTLARELKHPDSLAFAHFFEALLLGAKAEWRLALQSAEAGIAVADDGDSIQTLAWNRCVHGWAWAHSGCISSGLAELSAAIENSVAIMGQVALPQFCAMMAEVLLLQGTSQAAKQWVDRATTLMNANGDMYFAAELYRLAALCEGQRADPSAAAGHLHMAIDVARRQGAKFFELRAALDLADLDTHSGRTAVTAALAAFPEPEPWPEIARAAAVLSTID